MKKLTDHIPLIGPCRVHVKDRLNGQMRACDNPAAFKLPAGNLCAFHARKLAPHLVTGKPAIRSKAP